MDYLKDILKPMQIKEFIELINNSKWISNLEKERFLGETLPHPQAWLVQTAYDAVKNECDFYQKLKQHRPDVHDYLVKFQYWLDREDKTYNNFPGFGDQFSDENIFDFLKPIPIIDNELSDKWEFPVSGAHPIPDDIKIPNHSHNIDTKKFLGLLSSSCSFTSQEKGIIINNLPNLNQFQVNELIRSLTEEQEMINEVDNKYIKKKDEISFQENNNHKIQLDYITDSKIEKTTRVEGDNTSHSNQIIDDDWEFHVSGPNPIPENIKIPGHSHIIDEKEFLHLLSISFSLTGKEKLKIIENLPNLSTFQVNELIKILRKEQKQFDQLRIKHEKEKDEISFQRKKNQQIDSDYKTNSKIERIAPIKGDKYLHENIIDDDWEFPISGPYPIPENIKIPEHEHNIDEKEFLHLLSNSVSFTSKEKGKIIDNLPNLSTFQINEMIRILREEEKKFEELNIKHEKQLIAFDKRSAINKGYVISPPKEKGLISDDWEFPISGPYPIPENVEIPEHSHNIDEKEFLNLLSISVSLTSKEKGEILNNLSKLSKFQVNELIKILRREQQQFDQLRINAEKEKEKERTERRERTNRINKIKEILKKNWDNKDEYIHLIEIFLKIENQFQRYLFTDVIQTIKESLSVHSNLFYFYEYYFQALKINDELKFETIHTVLQDNFDTIPEDLYELLVLLYDFEELYFKDERIFLNKLEDYSPSIEYAFIKPYLRSKFQLYYGKTDDSLNQAEKFITEAIIAAANLSIEILLYLYHFKIKIFMAQKNFKEISVILNILFQNEDVIPAYYRYAELMGYYLDDSDIGIYEKNSKHALDCFIQYYIQTHNLKNLADFFPDQNIYESLSDNQESEKLWNKILELDPILHQLGFVNDEEKALEEKLNLLIDKGEYRQAQQLIESVLKVNQWSIHEYSCINKYFILLNKQDRLNELYEPYKTRYQKNPTFHNTFCYLEFLSHMKYKYRYENKDLAIFFTDKYYFLPISHLLFFEIEHNRFIKNTLSNNAEKKLAIALSCGISTNIFYLYSEYYRWKHSNLISNIFSLIDAMMFGGIFTNNIIGTYIESWKKYSIAFALISLHRNSYDGGIYNCLALSLTRTKGLQQLIAGLLIVKAQNVNHSWHNTTFFTNKVSEFNNVMKDGHFFLSSILYFAMMAVEVDPHKTWNSYIYILLVSKLLERSDYYLPAIYTAIDYDCPQIKSSDREESKKMADQFLTNRSELMDFSHAVFMAVALLENTTYWIEEKNIPDIEAIAFDALYQAENILNTKQISQYFLGEHAHEVFLMQTARDEYLFYRYPEKSYIQKYQVKLEQLRKLFKTYPQFQSKDDIVTISHEKIIRGFIARLDSGRVESAPSTTLEQVHTQTLDILEKFIVLRNVYLENIGEIRDWQDSMRQSIVIKILQKLDPILISWNKTDQLRFKNEINTFFKTKGNASLYEKQFLEDLLKNNATDYNINKIMLTIQNIINNYIELFNKNEEQINKLERKINTEQIQACLDIFQVVKDKHVMHHSNMFESFRKRIRHGWLIASLKDGFARHDLYMDGDEKDIAPNIDTLLNNINEDRAKAEIESELVDLKQTFNRIAQKLDKDILYLKDDEHPQGLLDYSDNHFKMKDNIAVFFKQEDLSKQNIEKFIRFCCKQLDIQTQKCFESIKKYMDQSVYNPLNEKLKSIAKKLEKNKHAISRDDMDSLMGRIDNASIHFHENIEKYKTWFGFYRLAIRDFTLSEAIEAAEKIVWDINLTQVKEKNISKASTHYSNAVEHTYFLGENFNDILEIFKILFQNVVYHSKTPDNDNSNKIDIKIEVDMIANDDNNKKFMVVFTSRYDDAYVDTAHLMEMVCNDERKQQAMSKSHGTGLATIADILINRLKGARGNIIDIRFNKQENQFQVIFEIFLTKSGKPSELSREETLQTISVEDLAAEAMKFKDLKILIVEDQSSKFQAIRHYVDSILSGCHISHTWDVETTCRLLLSPELKFDLIILDMTLPLDPSFDSDLKSLAGLIVLKVMSIHNIKTPVVIVTQYSNWAAEAARTNRVFIEKTNLYCSNAYKECYKGVIRFSHTETSWQKQLREIIYSLQEMAATYSEKGDYAKAIEFYENELKTNPKDTKLLLILADAQRQAENFLEAVKAYENILEISPNNPDAISGMALTYAEMGDSDSSDNYFNKYKAISDSESDSLKERILNAKLKTINHRRQQLYRSEMMATLGQMAAGMSHELRTPLQRILTNAQLTIRESRKGNLTHEVIESNMLNIEDAVKMMSEQINHIRTLAKDDHMKTEAVDVNSVISNAFEFFRQQLQNYQINIRLDLYKNMPKINANPSRLEQIFINLIQNARDALIPVKGRKKEILVRTLVMRGDKPAVQIHFEDNGIGIVKNLVDKIFEPFFSTKKTGKGMGLGLSIIQDIVSELSGEIKLYRESSVGLSFIIIIPIKEMET